MRGPPAALVCSKIAQKTKQKEGSIEQGRKLHCIVMQSSCVTRNTWTSLVPSNNGDHHQQHSRQQHDDECGAGIDSSPRYPGRKAAIKLNHEAVTLLMSGSEEDKAMEILKLSLVYVKSDLAPRSTPASSPPPASPKSPRSRDCKDDQEQQRYPVHKMQTLRCRHNDRPSRHSSMRAMPVHDNSILPFVKDASLSLYTNAFAFDLSNFEDSTCSHPSSSVDSETLSAAIIYNLALALTLKALRTNSSDVLRRAMRLYEMCMELVRKIMMLPGHANQEETLSYELALTVAIACSNNLGQLAYSQCENELGQSMRRTLQCLLSIPDSLSLITDQDESSGINRLLFSENDIQRFSLNVLFMHPPTSAATA